MSFRSGTQKYGDTLVDEFVSVSGGYKRNFALEQRIDNELARVEQYKTKFKGKMNPDQIPLPSWWEAGKKGWREDYPNDVEALEYLERSRALEQARIDLMDYKCNYYPRDTNYCQNATQRKGVVNSINRVIGLVQASIKESEFKFPDILPEVFAEEDPSIYQSGEPITLPSIYGGQYVPGVERETVVIPTPEQEIKCPARVRIINNETNQASGDGFFNCDTIEQYTEDPRYRVEYYDGVTPTTTPTPTPTTDHVTPPEETRCYMVHGQKLELTEQAVGYYINIGVTVTPCGAITEEVPTPSQVPTDFEYGDITTDHVDPPEMPVEKLPMVTPTEPDQVNWIPEPFFSFINSVFRK